MTHRAPQPRPSRRPRVRVACAHVAKEGADVRELLQNLLSRGRWVALCAPCADRRPVVLELHEVIEGPALVRLCDATALAFDGDPCRN